MDVRNPVNTVWWTIRHLVQGAVVGAVLVVLGLVVVLGSAFLTSSDVHLPGVISAWSSTENGLPALVFEPHPLGLLVVVIAIAVVSTRRGLARRRPRPTVLES